MGGVTSRARGGALICLAAWAMGGCSWAFMTRPPEGVVQPAERVDCTESKGTVSLDWLAAGFFGVPGLAGLIVAGAACGEEAAGPCTTDDLWLGLGSLAALGVAAAYVASATNGEANARRCVELRCASGVEASCRKLPPPPPPPPPPEPSAPWEGATDALPQGVPATPPGAPAAPSPGAPAVAPPPRDAP
jgi:hypothetical protein